MCDCTCLCLSHCEDQMGEKNKVRQKLVIFPLFKWAAGKAGETYTVMISNFWNEWRKIYNMTIHKVCHGTYLRGFCGTKQVGFLMESGVLGSLEPSACRPWKRAGVLPLFQPCLPGSLGSGAGESQAPWSMVGMCFGEIWRCQVIDNNPQVENVSSRACLGVHYGWKMVSP